MTRIIGTATDPESGEPVVGRRVDAYITPRNADMSGAPLDPPSGVDHAITDDGGQWQLNLRETYGRDAFYIIRVWLHSTVTIDVPIGPGPLLVESVTIDVPDDEPDLPPSWMLPDYIQSSEKGSPSGVATLGTDGKLAATQRWTTSGGGGDSGPLAYTHEQIIPSSVWLVTHDLPFRPSGVVVYDHLGDRHVPAMTFVNDTTIQMNFDANVRGQAYLS